MTATLPRPDAAPSGGERPRAIDPDRAYALAVQRPVFVGVEDARVRNSPAFSAAVWVAGIDRTFADDKKAAEAMERRHLIRLGARQYAAESLERVHAAEAGIVDLTLVLDALHPDRKPHSLVSAREARHALRGYLFRTNRYQVRRGTEAVVVEAVLYTKYLAMQMSGDLEEVHYSRLIKAAMAAGYRGHDTILGIPKKTMDLIREGVAYERARTRPKRLARKILKTLKGPQGWR